MVKVYTKDNCPACTATILWLDRRGIAYEATPFEDSPEAQALAQLHGLRTAPLCIHNGQIWTGFRPEYLAEIQK